MSDFQQELPKLLPEIMASPRLYVHSLGPDKATARVIEADREFFRNADTLDQGVIQSDNDGGRVPLDALWRHVDASAGGRMAPAHFIFHTGQCGSTLISRLLDEFPSVLGLREPLLLRTMATRLGAAGTRSGEQPVEMFKRVYQLLVRRFSPGERVIIKPASMCNNLAAILLAQNPANRGLLLFVTLEVYLARMLDRNDNAEIDEFLAHRTASLAKIVPDLDMDTSALSFAERLAFSWFTEAAQLFNLGTRGLAPRVLLIDFDRFLAQSELELRRILRHFSIPADAETVHRILAGPRLGPHAGSHAGWPEPAVMPDDRAAALKHSMSSNSAALKEGMRFADRLMKKHPDLGEMTGKIPLA